MKHGFMRAWKIVLGSVIVVVFCFGAYSQTGVNVANHGSGRLGTHKNARRSSQLRIVSLAPSITEILFFLGLGEKLVGVTRFCDFPKAALKISKVGGYYDPNQEAIIALQPDVVVLLEEHQETQQFLHEAGIRTTLVSHRTIPDIYASIRTIGRLGNVEQLAEEQIRLLRRRVEGLTHKKIAQPPIKVMISTGRNMGTGSVRSTYIAGRAGLYNEMIEIVGATNAYQGDLAFPLVTKEGIVRMNPDVIVDAVPDLNDGGNTKNEIVGEWNHLQQVSAVKQGNVHVLTEDYVVVPGPRFVLMLEQLAQIVADAQTKVTK